MQENNDFHFDDTKDIEMSDLSASEDSASEPLVKRVSLGPRYSFRQRRRQVIITTSIILFTLLVILGSSFQIRGFIAAKIFGSSIASSTPGPLIGSNYFYFQTLPSWGTFFFDGKPLTHIPTLNDEAPVRLPAGEHVLEWRAEPFQPLSCTLAVPPNAEKQTCNVRLSGSNGYAQNASVVAFPQTLSLNQLPVAQRESLTQAVQNLLDTLQSSSTVQSGEYYTYNWNAPLSQAKTALNAQIRFLLDTDTTKPAYCDGLRFGPSCSFAGNDCRNFCTLTWPQSSDEVATDGWHVAAIIRPTWTYSIPGKQTMVHAQSMDSTGDQNFVMLHITWQQGQWHVAFHLAGTSSFDDPNCISTISSIMIKPIYNSIGQQRVIWTFSSGSNRASGCLATATLHNGDDLRTAPVQTPNAYVLQRFGVLMVGNNAAHKLWPNLPMADDYAQSVMQDIMQKPAFIS